MSDERNISSNDESLANTLVYMTHEQLVQRCVGLSRALDEVNLDSGSGDARMLLERVLAEMRPLKAKNVRLQRDIEAFLNGDSSSQSETTAERPGGAIREAQLYRALERLHYAVKNLAEAHAFDLTGPVKSDHESSLWLDLNAAQANAAQKIEHFAVKVEADDTCPRCLGSGTIEVPDEEGPNAHPMDITCPWCKGTGSLQKASTDPNPLDPTNRHFRKCLKGHVSYSASFPECPSCKVERERAVKASDESNYEKMSRLIMEGRK